MSSPLPRGVVTVVQPSRLDPGESQPNMAGPKIKFRCYQCNQLLGVAHSKAGKVVACPKCATELVVPDARRNAGGRSMPPRLPTTPRRSSRPSMPGSRSSWPTSGPRTFASSRTTTGNRSPSASTSLGPPRPPSHLRSSRRWVQGPTAGRIPYELEAYPTPLAVPIAPAAAISVPVPARAPVETGVPQIRSSHPRSSRSGRRRSVRATWFCLARSSPPGRSSS